ncbi:MULTISPECIES: MFS transporter [unclassified Sphingobium]|uniref:MFS transporter n=1 Tax=unclassified Sphingobium TaxID=2611147 RepID=UPI00119B5C4F|nr:MULTISPECIES: MFS transporter [unclassified Sphingobium]MBG6120138.1 MFS family permease [Sphingobium sp. JAI105]TWD05661.1 Na+/melibiose symporter-like transporter [Sphingobium sp. AEW010]TWD23214.1 Na+/melibiose symporter-like transporter [Sphingobium sp. AEW013]TWD25074.1 Na+/melibiose symporter-like transporter [Sphingobium sp. AEW001]
MRAEWRAHWPAALTASIGVATGYSMFQYNASQFIQPWQQAFGWSRGEIAIAQNGLIVAALLSPVAGMLLDRYGVRRPLLAAIVATVLAYGAMALNNGSLALFYGTYFILQIVGLLTTGLAFTRVVAERFDASCGLALASTRIGLSLFGIFLPSLLHSVIAGYGWRSGFLLLAAILLLVGLPVSFFGVRPVKRAAGGVPAADHSRPTRVIGGAIGWRTIMICLAAGFGYAPITAILSQLQPLLTGKGLAGSEAAMLTGLLAGSVILGVVITGLLVDRIWAPLVAAVVTLAPVGGLLILLLDDPSLTLLAAAVTLIGMAQGAEIDLVAFLVRRYHPLNHYSRIYGLTILCNILFGIVGHVGMAFVYDATGDYRIGLLACIGSLILSVAAFLALGRYPQLQTQRTP